MSTCFADIFKPYNEEFKNKITNVVFWEDHSTELKEVACKKFKEVDQLILDGLFIDRYFFRGNELNVIYEPPYLLKKEYE